MKVIKTLGSVILIMALMLSFSAGAFADNWDLANGQVIISCDESGVQQVTQNAPPVADANPVITGEYTGVVSEQGLSNAVYLDTTNGDINVTFDNVTINDACISAGTVPNEEATLNDVTMTFTGDNKVSTGTDEYSAIYIEDVKNATITGAGESATLNVTENLEGISINHSENVNIENITINASDNQGRDIDVFEVNNVNIKNSTINTSSGSEGYHSNIEISDVAEDVNIENSEINMKNADTGMGIYQAGDVKIENSSLNASTDATGIFISNTKNVAVNNSVIDTAVGYTGVVLTNTENATFDNSTINTNKSENGLLEHSVKNTEFNNCSIDVNSTNTAIQLAYAENATFTNSNLNVNSEMDGLALWGVGNLNINGSDVSVNAKEIAVYFNEEPNLQISGSTMTTPKSINIAQIDAPYATEPVFALADEYFKAVKEVKIVKNPAPAPARTADAEGKSVGESFSFACAESDVQSVSYGGVTLTKGTDYTISTSGGMLKITFTDAFFAAHGNGPHYITINIGGVIYNLTVVRN